MNTQQNNQVELPEGWIVQYGTGDMPQSVLSERLIRCTEKELLEFLIKTRQEAVENNNKIKNYYEVAQHLRKFARDHFMKLDDKAEGFYSAIKEIERYFGVQE